MFTGIVEELGEVTSVDRLGDFARVSIRGPKVTAATAPGGSIAVNGVCLTVAEVEDGLFDADVVAETLARSSLGGVRPGTPVNLERPLALADGLGGHLVQGHVDGTGRVLERTAGQHAELVSVSLPTQLARYVAVKGSIAVDGVSLTVVEAAGDSFTVSLIPTTLEMTTLGSKQAGETVNLEVDVVAKYVERLMEGRS